MKFVITCNGGIMQAMATVIRLSDRRKQPQWPVDKEELLERMMCYVSRDNSDHLNITLLLVCVLQDPDCPDMNLSQLEIGELDRLIARLDAMSWDDQLEALLVATFYMGDVTGWNPNIAKPLRSLPFSSETKLLIELSYGILGFAWQIHARKPVIFSQSEYYARRSELKKTP